MEAHYRAFNGKLVIKVEGTTIKDLFEQIGPIAEVLDGDDACGKCGSLHIYPRARDAQGFTYYELVCSECGAKLSFGQHKEGGSLWAKRVEKDGTELPNRGWIKYLGIAAPKQEEAPGRGRPATVAQPQKKEDPRLPPLLNRCASRVQTDAVIGELCDAIEGKSSKTIADQLWAEAQLKHGDPITRPAALAPVLLFLLDALDNYDKKKSA